MEFKINAMKADIDHVIRLFTPEKFRQFEESQNEIRKTTNSMEELEKRVFTCPTYGDLENIEKSFKRFSTKDQLRIVEDKILDFVKREEFEVLQFENNKT